MGMGPSEPESPFRTSHREVNPSDDFNIRSPVPRTHTIRPGAMHDR